SAGARRRRDGEVEGLSRTMGLCFPLPLWERVPSEAQAGEGFSPHGKIWDEDSDPSSGAIADAKHRRSKNGGRRPPMPPSPARGEGKDARIPQFIPPDASTAFTCQNRSMRCALSSVSRTYCALACAISCGPRWPEVKRLSSTAAT